MIIGCGMIILIAVGSASLLVGFISLLDIIFLHFESKKRLKEM